MYPGQSLGQADPDVVAALRRQLDDLKRRCPKGQAGPDCEKQILELEASIEALVTGRPAGEILAKKKASNLVRNVTLAGLAVFGLVLAARFFRR